MKTIKWIKTSNQHFKSEDGRFSIQVAGLGRKGYVLFDHHRQDSCQPQYSWSTHACTIRSAKSKGERILRTKSYAAV